MWHKNHGSKLIRGYQSVRVFEEKVLKVSELATAVLVRITV